MGDARIGIESLVHSLYKFVYFLRGKTKLVDESFFEPFARIMILWCLCESLRSESAFRLLVDIISFLLAKYVERRYSEESSQTTAQEKAEMSIFRSSQADVSCKICLESSEDFMSSPCGHVACKSCWMTFLSRNRICLFCRTKVTFRFLMKIYL